MALVNPTPKIKDPNAVLDYGMDWTQWLGVQETILSSVWTIPVGLVEVQSDYTDRMSRIRISGRTLGVNYTVTNTITVDSGEIEPQSFILQVRAT